MINDSKHHLLKKCKPFYNSSSKSESFGIGDTLTGTDDLNPKPFNPSLPQKTGKITMAIIRIPENLLSVCIIYFHKHTSISLDINFNNIIM